MSAGDACGDAALSAGCGSSIAIAVVQPGYDTPVMPTRPLLLGTCVSNQSMLSYASVLSSIAFGSARLARGGRCITNCPSDLNLPRMSWNTNT